MFSNLIKTTNLFNRHANLIKNDQLHQQFRSYRLRRALLYVPGDDQRKIDKTRNLKVDSLIFDCEDGVAVNRKQAAREKIAILLKAQEQRTTDWGVRVNSADSGLLGDDLAAICSNGLIPQTLHLPKVNCRSDLDQFHAALVAAIGGGGGTVAPLPAAATITDLFIYSESCSSILALPQLCEHAVELSRRGQHFRLAGIIFGSDDLCANLGATRTESCSEIVYARQFVVMVAKAFKLQAIDMVDINFNDVAGLQEQCIRGAQMGYTGKQVIHPKQVEIVQDAFKPSAVLVDWATGVLDAFAEHQRTGKGAFTFRNQMIDAPTMKQARNIIDAIEKVTKFGDGEQTNRK